MTDSPYRRTGILMWPMLDYLIGKTDMEPIRQLLAEGADPDERNTDGFPMITLASKRPEMMQLLLDHGAEIDAKCAGWTTMMRAAYQGETESAVWLITRGAALDAQTDDGRTILQMLRENDRGDVADLLQYTADTPAREKAEALQAVADYQSATHNLAAARQAAMPKRPKLKIS